jgi:hypothetical protein
MAKAIVILQLLIIISFSSLLAQTNNIINYTEINTIHKIIEKYYVQKINDDTLSARTFDNFIKIQSNSLPILTAQEYSELAKNKYNF